MKKIALLGAASMAAAATMLVRDGEAPPEQLTRELSFEIRADRIDDERRTVELTFSSEEPYERWWGTEILDHSSGAVRLDRLNAGGALLMDHNTRDQIGVVERAWIDGRKGRAIVRFGRSARAEEIFQDVKDGIRKLVSVGYRIHELVLERLADGVENYRATDWEPYEISLVAVPADPTVGVGRDGEPAGFDPRTLLQTEEEDDMSRATRNAGGGAAPATSPAAAVTGAAPTAPTAPAAPATPPQNRSDAPPPQAPAPVAPPATDGQRTAPEGVSARRIRDVVSRSNLGSDFALELIARNEETPLTEAALTDAIAERLEQQRNTTPINANRVGDRGIDSAGYRSALEGSILLRAGRRGDLTDEEIRAAREFGGMSLIELARFHLEQEGVSTRGMDRMTLAGASLGLRAGQHTTGDFAQILSNAANRVLRRAYEAMPQTFRPFTIAGTLPDFKPAPLVGLGDAPALLLVAENGEFKYGSMADFGDTYKLATYGRIIAITRQTIINDDLNVFSRIPAGFGAQAAQLESDLVYAQLLANPTMYDGNALFSTAHANLAGSGGAINEGTLAAAEQAILTQKSPEGTQLNLMPRFLIVGPAKKVEAQKMLAAVIPNATSGVNVFQNAMELIVEARITGNQWFVAADPATIDTIRLDSLEGQDGVYTETRVGFDVDGVEMKARVDRVAKVVDWRGFYRNPGN